MTRAFETSVTLRSRVHVAAEAAGAPFILALHGKGMRPGHFARWLEPGLSASPDSLSCWVPEGIRPYELTGERRRVGFAWYCWDGTQEVLRSSMEEARSYLVELTHMARRTLRPSRVVVVGFSQGAYLGSFLALGRPDLFDALVCCCGRPKAEFVEDLASARNVRVLVQTGSRDEAVPPSVVERGVAPLEAAGLRVESRSYDAPHKLTPDMARDAALWAREAD